MDEIKREYADAAAEVPVRGLCYYPIIERPCWDSLDWCYQAAPIGQDRRQRFVLK